MNKKNDDEQSTSKYIRVLFSIIGLLIIITIWEIGAQYLRENSRLGDKLFPSLLVIFTESWKEFAVFSNNTFHSESLQSLFVLAFNSAVTLRRVAVGEFIGILLGISLGLIMAYSERMYKILIGPISFIKPVAGPAVIPLFILWFGGSELGFYSLIAYLTFVIIVISSYNAAKNVSITYQKYASTMGASKFDIYRTVVLPAMLPEVFSSIRIVLAMGWSFALGAEFLGSQKGMGFLMIRAGQFGFLGRVIVVVFLFTIYSVLTDVILLRLRDRIFSWMPE